VLPLVLVQLVLLRPSARLWVLSVLALLLLLRRVLLLRLESLVLRRLWVLLLRVLLCLSPNVPQNLMPQAQPR
jgi:hypothetical protein